MSVRGQTRFVSMLLGLLTIGFQSALADFGTDEILDLNVIQNSRMSPNGEAILYTVREADIAANGYKTNLWIVDWDGGEPRLLVGDSDVQMPAWSPDSREIAFISRRSGERRIWIVDVESGELRSVTSRDPGHGEISVHVHYSGLEWSPSGDRLVFAAQDLVEPDDPLIWHDWHRTEGFGDIRRRIQIWTVDTESGDIKQVTSGDFHHGQPTWSPDGTQIAFMSNRLGREESILWSINENYDIWLTSSDGGDPKQLTTNDGPDTMPVWSPDGESLAYITVPYQGSHRDVTRLSSVNVTSGEVTSITDLRSFDYGVSLETGAWAGSRIFFTAIVGASTHAFYANPDQPDEAPVPIVRGERVVSSISVSRDGRRIAHIIEDPYHPSEVWKSSATGRGLAKVVNANPDIERTDLATTETVSWKSYDGLEIEGIVVKPAGFDPNRKYPLIVRPHGGPHGVSGLKFHIGDQYYATRGYMVFAPNVRGSFGYGQAFIDADRGALGGGDFLDLMSGVDHLIERGLVDPNELFIGGVSYGGFMTSWAVGHTDRFKAAMAAAPVVNARSFFGTTDIPKWVTWEYLGLPWENPDLTRAYSPISYVQNVSTPTLIIHGENDVRVPLSQGLEFYRSLKAVGVDTQMVIYPGEMHASWSPVYQIDILERTVDWFSRHSSQ